LNVLLIGVLHDTDQSEGETGADGGPRKIIIWKDRNKSVQLLNVMHRFFSFVLEKFSTVFLLLGKPCYTVSPKKSTFLFFK